MTHYAPGLGPPEARKATRTGLFLGAILRGPTGTHSVRIRNLSSNGALLDISEGVARGDEVHLIRAHHNIAATVAWLDDRRCGLQFDHAVDIDEWIPKRAREHQTAVDRRVAAIRQGLDRSTSRSCSPATPTCLNLRIAEELEILGRHIELGLNELASYPPLVVRHAAVLQNLEVAVQTLNRMATIVSSEDPAAEIAGLGMDDLKRRLLRSSPTESVWDSGRSKTA